MDETTFRHIYDAIPDPPSWKELYEDKEEKYRALEKRLETLELVVSYAKDVVDFWPSMSMRTIRVMVPKMNALKEALGLVK